MVYYSISEISSTSTQFLHVINLFTYILYIYTGVCVQIRIFVIFIFKAHFTESNINGRQLRKLAIPSIIQPSKYPNTHQQSNPPNSHPTNPPSVPNSIRGVDTTHDDMEVDVGQPSRNLSGVHVMLALTLMVYVWSLAIGSFEQRARSENTAQLSKISELQLELRKVKDEYRATHNRYMKSREKIKVLKSRNKVLQKVNVMQSRYDKIFLRGTTQIVVERAGQTNRLLKACSSNLHVESMDIMQFLGKTYRIRVIGL